MPTGIETKPGLIVVGAFNPAIIKPHWLQAEGIVLPSDEAEFSFSVGGGQQFRFTSGGANWTVTPQRLALDPSGDPEVLPTLAREVLTRLAHTPITAIGINLSTRVSSDAWKADAPAPPESVEILVGKLGTMVSKSRSFQVSLKGGVVLIVTVREESGIYSIEQNYHYNVGGTAEALKVFDEFNTVIGEAKNFAMELASGGTNDVHSD